MGLPNATSLLSNLPNGMRAVVSRDSVVASYAIRTAVNDAGQFSPAGLDRDVKVNVWTLSADFNPKIKIGDVLVVDGTYAVVIDAMLTIGNLVNRANVLLFEDTITVTYNGVSVQALHSALADGQELSGLGERGVSAGRIRVIASQMAKPEKGATIIVNGKTCMAGATSTDPRGSILIIEYQETTPLR